MKKIYFFYCTLFLFLSCTQDPPIIKKINYDLIYDFSLTPPQERLSVFILTQDNEHIRQIRNMFIFLDTHALYWRIDARNKQIITEEQTYYGNNHLTFPEGCFPRAQYRVLIHDAAGYQSKSDFFLEKNCINTYTPINIRIDTTAQSQKNIILTPAVNKYEILFLNKDSSQFINKYSQLNTFNEEDLNLSYPYRVLIRYFDKVEGIYVINTPQ